MNHDYEAVCRAAPAKYFVCEKWEPCYADLAGVYNVCMRNEGYKDLAGVQGVCKVSENGSSSAPGRWQLTPAVGGGTQKMATNLGRDTEQVFL